MSGSPGLGLADERRHPAGTEPLWSESWYLDFAAEDGSLAGYVRLGLLPNQGVAWWWTYLVGDGRPLIAVRDHDVALPAGQALEVRAEGLWGELTCETPFEHWTVGLEAFGVALDDPVEALGAERGERVAVGLDLEWEAEAPAHLYSLTTRYEQACRVHGEVLVGRERVAFDGWGERDHSWGVRDWSGLSWCWVSGRLDDGTAFHALKPFLGVEGLDLHEGFVVEPGAGEAAGVDRVAVATELGAGGLPAAADLTVGPLDVRLEVVAPAPVPLGGAGGPYLARALCRVTAAGGRSGWAWGEWNDPGARLPGATPLG